MNQSKISVRYAKALFLSAKEENLLDTVHENLRLIVTSFSLKGFKEFIESPVVKISDKKKVFWEVYGEMIHELTHDFIQLVLTNKREKNLEGMIRYFISLYLEQQGIMRADLKVPFSVSEEYKKKFIDLLENTFQAKIEMQETVDTELIGGFILKVDDQQYDASVKTSLSKIKKRLLKTAIEK